MRKVCGKMGRGEAFVLLVARRHTPPSYCADMKISGICDVDDGVRSSCAHTCGGECDDWYAPAEPRFVLSVNSSCVAGSAPITTAAECAAAARELVLADTTPDEGYTRNSTCNPYKSACPKPSCFVCQGKVVFGPRACFISCDSQEYGKSVITSPQSPSHRSLGYASKNNRATRALCTWTASPTAAPTQPPTPSPSGSPTATPTAAPI